MSITYSKKPTDRLAVDLPEEPNFAVVLITERFLDLVETWGEKEIDAHDYYLEGLGILKAYAESKKVKLPDDPHITNDKEKNITAINNYFQNVYANAQRDRNRLVVEKVKSKYKEVFSGDFFYEFTDGDLKQIQSILNELRDLITNSKELEEDYKRRLLNKLEKLQKELHKKVATLDNIWGLVGDAGVVIGKFGEDAKPIVDRITALVNIVWRVQSLAEELPLGTPYPLLKESAATFNDSIESSNEDDSKKTEEKQ